MGVGRIVKEMLSSGYGLYVGLVFEDIPYLNVSPVLRSNGKSNGTPGKITGIFWCQNINSGFSFDLLALFVCFFLVTILNARTT